MTFYGGLLHWVWNLNKMISEFSGFLSGGGGGGVVNAERFRVCAPHNNLSLTENDKLRDKLKTSFSAWTETCFLAVTLKSTMKSAFYQIKSTIPRTRDFIKIWSWEILHTLSLARWITVLDHTTIKQLQLIQCCQGCNTG